jgi:hypothetical protein
MRFEILTSGFAFFATSLYWLFAAFRLSATEYGQMMQLQALIIIVTAIFSLRTHDLVFYLQKSHSWELRRSFYFAQSLEIALVVLSTASAISLLLLNSILSEPVRADVDLVTWTTISLLANSTLIQGSSLAYLRAQHLDVKIAKSDLYAIGAWGAALLLLAIWKNPKPQEVLVVGFAASAIKPMALWIVSRATPTVRLSRESMPMKTINKKEVCYFLLGGQLTNMLKNGMISIETLLLGLMMSPESVAIFRVSRSFFGLTTAMLNITYQKTFRELVKQKTDMEIKLTITRFNSKSLKLWAISIPPIIVASFLFSYLKNDAAYSELPFITLLISIAFLPIAVQQSDYALLTLGAKFKKISIAYIVGGGVLLLSALSLNSQMTLPLFVLIIGVANFLRYWFIRYAASSVFN